MTINDVADNLLTFLQWTAGIAAGSTIAYFMLTHLAGHVFKSSIWFITITIILFLYAYYIQPFVDFWTPVIQWQLTLVYQNTPQEMALRIWDLALLGFSIFAYSLTAHPEKHG